MSMINTTLRVLKQETNQCMYYCLHEQLKVQAHAVELTMRKQPLEVIKLEYSLKLKINHNDWLLADMSASSQSLRFILSLRMKASFITSRPETSSTMRAFAGAGCSGTYLYS